MDRHYAEGFVDLQMGDIIEVDGIVGPIYDLRFIQELRDSNSYFECRLENGDWVSLEGVRVIQRITRGGVANGNRSRKV